MGGIVRGSYSYVDGDGIIQSVNYIADALGFRVGATNLPVHVVDTGAADVAVGAADAAVGVAAQPAVDVAYKSQPVVAASPVISPLISYSYLPYASNYGYNLPVEGLPVAQVASEEVAPVVQEAAVPEVTVNAVPVAAAPSVPNDVSS